MKRIETARSELGDIDQTGNLARFFDDGPRTLQARIPAARSSKKLIQYDNAKPVGNLRFTFEDGDLQGWKTVEGELPDALTNRKDLPNHKTQPFNKQGQWFLFTGNQKNNAAGSDQQTGVIESPVFTLKGKQISFLIGGGSGNSTYVALCDSDGKELMKASGPNGPALHRINWDASKHIGQQLKIRLVDHSKGGWGHVTFDDFSCEGELLTQ